jgi:hypothetical protein
MDGTTFQSELLSRLPLAQAVFRLFAYALPEPFLREVYEEHRGRCYEKALTFPQLVYLIRDALLVHGGSGHRSFRRADEAGELPVAVQNAYGKLARLPLPLSLALLSGGTRRLAELLPPGHTPDPPPASLRGMRPVAVDGKKLKNAAKRLKALRGLPGKLLGAKLLAGLSLDSGLVVAMSADPDGEANDVPLVPGLLPQVRANLPAGEARAGEARAGEARAGEARAGEARAGEARARPILWVADCQFCDLNLPALFTAGGDHLLVRFTNKMGFHPDPARPALAGVDGRGRPYVPEWGWIGSAKDGRRRYVRRVTLARGDGERDVALITDLLDERAYPAVDLLGLYLMRWGIERVFQQVTEVFDLRHLIGSTPRAMVFQAAFCFLLYNMVQVARAYAAAAAGRPAEEVSTENLFYDAAHELITWAKVGEPAHAAAHLAGPMPAGELRRELAGLIGPAWTDRWIKARNKTPRKPTPTPGAKRSGAHTSVWRVLQQHHPSRQTRAAPARIRS